jgi:hypothetical protein
MTTKIPEIGDIVEVYGPKGVINICYRDDIGKRSVVLSRFLNKNGYLMVVLEQDDGNCVCIMAHYVREVSVS